MNSPVVGLIAAPCGAPIKLNVRALVGTSGSVAVAVNVNITFMKAGQAGTLWAEARELSRNFKLGTYTVEVKDDAGDLVAVFQGMVYRKSDKIPD